MKVIEKLTNKIYENNIVLKKDEQFLSMQQIRQHTEQCANILSQQKEDSVILLCEDSFDFIISFLASILAQKQIFLIDDKKKLHTLKEKQKLEKYIEIKSLESFKNLNNKETNTKVNLEQINPQKIFINFLTSGSTSEPKIIRKNLYNLEKEAEELLNTFSIKPNTIFSSTTKLCHMFGMSFQFMLPFVGGFVIDTKPINYPEECDRENTIIVSTPSFLDKIEKYNVTFKNPPKCFFTAGAKLKQKTFEYLEKQSNVIEIYGSTESGIIAYKTNSKTQTLQSFENVDIDCDKDSNIVVKSEFFVEDNVTLFDVIEIVENNKFIIKERSDRMVKIQEKRISLEEYEENIKTHEFVNDVLCIKHSEKLCCFVSLNQKGIAFYMKNGIINTIKNIKSYIAERNEIVPQKWRFIAEIPKTQTGKTNKRVLEQILSTNLSFPIVYKIEQEKEKTVIYLKFDKNSNFFKGHFDGFEILAGVVQIYYAKLFAETYLNTTINTNKTKKIKFTHIIKPEENVRLILTKEKNNIKFLYEKENNKLEQFIQCSSGLLTINEDNICL